MKGPSPPIRFLLTVVCGWAGFRAAMLAPWADDTRQRKAGVAAVGPAPVVMPPDRIEIAQVSQVRSSLKRSNGAGVPLGQAGTFVPHRVAKPLPPASISVARAPAPTSDLAVPAQGTSEPRPLAAVVPPAFASLPPSHARWSASAWLFVRRGLGEAALAPGGTLGGSQAGARVSYRLNGRLSLSLRLYAPLNDKRAAEAALGLDWKPLRALPFRLLAERRERLGRDGGSALGLSVYGGIDTAAGRFRLDAYGQAGIVGARRRDLFADGAARITLPLGRLRLGGGAWAAAQPGVSRVDAGPHGELTLGAGSGSVTLAADWRFRLGGRAKPGSGPAVTLSTGF
jgi:hypothetical protein